MFGNAHQSGIRRSRNGGPVKVLAVCSGKGGVGKTNVACNLAVALGSRGLDTCLLDADLGLANVDVLLGLQPSFNLSHVVNEQVDLASTILRGPQDIRIIPAASGNFCMTELPSAAQFGIIQAFGELTKQPEILVVDTAAGIAPNVARFVQASEHAVVVVCDEPAALTDAYALIKVFSQNYGISRFQVITNQSQRPGHGRVLFGKLSRVANTYLDVVLHHLGDIPRDDYLVRAVQEQRAVVDAYPKSPAGRAIHGIAAAVESLPVAHRASGNIQFFLERVLLAETESRGKVA